MLKKKKCRLVAFPFQSFNLSCIFFSQLAASWKLAEQVWLDQAVAAQTETWQENGRNKWWNKRVFNTSEEKGWKSICIFIGHLQKKKSDKDFWMWRIQLKDAFSSPFSVCILQKSQVKNVFQMCERSFTTCNSLMLELICK